MNLTCIITVMATVFSIVIKLLLLDKNLMDLSKENIVNNIFFWIMLLIFNMTIFYRIFKDRKLLKEILNAQSILSGKNPDNIDITYQEIDEKFLDENEFFNLKNTWISFKNSLIMNIYQTLDAEEYYNRETLMYERMNYKLVNYIPHLLVGMGMLGTFLGLSIGLADLNLGSDNMKQLVNLISGTKTAFYTSLYGMYFSIFITIALNVYFGNYEEKILRLKNKINNTFKKYLKDSTIEEIKNEIINVKHNTQELSKNVGIELVKGIKEYNENNTKHLDNISKLVQANISGLADSVSDSFEKRLKKIFSNEFITPFITLKEKLIEVSKFNNEEVSRSVNFMKALENDLEKISKSFKNISDIVVVDFNNIMDRVENKYKEIVELVTTTQELNKRYIETLQNSEIIITESNECLNQLDGISKTFNSFSSQEESLIKFWTKNRELVSNLSENLEKTKEVELKKIDEYQEKVLNKIEEHQIMYLDKIRAQEEKLAEVYEKNTRNLFEEYDGALTKVIINFKDILDGLVENISSIKTIINTSKEESRNLEEKQIEMSISQRQEINSLVNEFKGIISETTNNFKDILNGLTENVSNVKEIMNVSKEESKQIEEKQIEIRVSQRQEISTLINEFKEIISETTQEFKEIKSLIDRLNLKPNNEKIKYNENEKQFENNKLKNFKKNKI